MPRKSSASDRTIGEYRLIKKIAEGGFGATYLAEHMALKAPACIKQGFLTGDDSETILFEEARALWDLRHFAIPAMRGVLKVDDGSHALVMSYIPGPTLEKVIEKVGKLDPEHVAWITERVLNALLYIHTHGVVHGDLKPQNIIIQPESHSAVIVDFGLSAIRPTAGTSSKGYTEVFSPPEQMDGGTLLPESDFFSLGKTMLYMLGGGYDAATKVQVPASVPDPICDFIKRLIVRDVTERPRWEDENLFETFRQIRHDSFGRSRSGMKPIPGF